MERSHPFIEVSIAGKTVHDAFYQRLVSATIRDEPGQSADTLELVFDDTAMKSTFLKSEQRLKSDSDFAASAHVRWEHSSLSAQAIILALTASA
ncbi:hypothetical protein M8994_13025 [Brucella sp. 21LCYQ03]|nr:hypothetical protein [Brucella sp. 21LCYQ03]